MFDVFIKLFGHPLRLVQLDRALPGWPVPVRRSVSLNVLVHAVNRGRRLCPMLQQPRILGLRIVVVVQLAVDEVAEVGRIVGQVKLFEKFDEVLEVQNQGVVLKIKSKSVKLKIRFIVNFNVAINICRVR